MGDHTYCELPLSVQGERICESKRIERTNSFINQIDVQKLKKRTYAIIDKSLDEKYNGLSAEALISLLNNQLSQEETNIDHLFPAMIRYGQDYLGYSKDDNADLLYSFLLFEPFYYNTIDSIVVDLLDQDYQKLFSELNLSNDIINVFNMHNLNRVCDLETISLNCLIVILFYNLKDFLKAFKGNPSFPIDPVEMFSVAFDVIKDVSEKEEKVVKMRYGCNGNQPATLQEIGKYLHITREGARQILLKASRKLCGVVRAEKSKYCFVAFYILKNGKKYLSFEQMKEIFGDNYLIILAVLEIWNDGNICMLSVNREYKLVYDANLFSADEILHSIQSELPATIDPNCLPNMTETQTIFFQKHYHLSYGVCVPNNIYKKDIVAGLIEQYFPNGYRIGDEDDYKLLKSKFVDDLHIGEKSVPSMRAVVGSLDHSERFILRDKGTYINLNNCPLVPDELVNEIVKFINNRPYKYIYYSEIYNEFSDALIALGVDNMFYFKGLIDGHLPNYIKTKRNYLINTSFFNEKSSRAIDNIVSKIKSYELDFSLYDLQHEFPGITVPTLYGALYNEKNHGLLFLDKKRYVYIQKLSFEKDTLDLLNEEIDKCFAVVGYDILDINLIFSRLSVTNKKLLTDLNRGAYNLIQDTTSFFSLIENIFAKKYRFGRPFVSKLGYYVKLKGANILAHYVRDNRIVTNDRISRVAHDIGYRLNYIGYDEVYLQLRHSHVVVSGNRAVQKDSFNISQHNLDEIAETLDQLIRIGNKTYLRTASIKDFNIFPDLYYAWNTHLLIGIIRSYLSKSFSVEREKQNGCSYLNANYIIRRRNHA